MTLIPVDRNAAPILAGWKKAAMKLSMLLVAFTVADNFSGDHRTWAQTTYPTHTVKIVVPFPPGGGTDITARMLARRFQQKLGSPFVVENKPGGDAIIAFESVKRASPDGYTLLLGQSTGMTVNPVVYPNLPYQPLTDFSPISTIGTVPLVLAVNAQSDITSLDQLIEKSKQSAGTLTIGSPSTAYLLVVKLLAREMKFSFNSIPYRGSGPAMNALLTREIEAALVDMSTIKPQVDSGIIRALAVTSSSRSEFLPNVPTLKELGSKDVQIEFWSGLFAPAGTPAAIVEKLRQEISDYLGTAEMKEQADLIGMKAVASDPDTLRGLIERDIKIYSTIADSTNVTTTR